MVGLVVVLAVGGVLVGGMVHRPEDGMEKAERIGSENLRRSARYYAALVQEQLSEQGISTGSEALDLIERTVPVSLPSPDMDIDVTFRPVGEVTLVNGKADATTATEEMVLYTHQEENGLLGGSGQASIQLCVVMSVRLSQNDVQLHEMACPPTKRYIDKDIRLDP